MRARKTLGIMELGFGDEQDEMHGQEGEKEGPRGGKDSGQLGAEVDGLSDVSDGECEVRADIEEHAHEMLGCVWMPGVVCRGASMVAACCLRCFHARSWRQGHC